MPKMIPPPPPVTKLSFSPFDRSPSEARREFASIGRDDDALEERQDRHFYAKLARTDRYGR